MGDSISFGGSYIGLNFSGGMVFGAETPGDLVGFFLGGQVGASGGTGVPNLVVSGDYLQGFNVGNQKFTSAREADVGFSLGLGGSEGIGVQFAGSFFIPMNMPGWVEAI